MRTATVSLKNYSQYGANHVVLSQKKEGEGPDEYEDRTWRERLNVDNQGRGIIPNMAFKMCLESATRRYGGKIRGKGNATWTKHFESGVLVFEPLILDVTRETVAGERLHVPSDGVRGSGKRVWKTFPVVHTWGGDVTYSILDSAITEPVFEDLIVKAFQFVGIGRFRPEKCGFYGRAEVTNIKWEGER